MKRVLAISLLLIFTAGQLNLTWATHFCGEFAVQNSVAIGIDDLSCGMEEESCCDEDSKEITGPIITTEECCSNDYYSSDADDFFIKIESENDKQIQFITVYTVSLYKQLYSTEYKCYTTTNFPRLKSPERQVLYQTFLL